MTSAVCSHAKSIKPSARNLSRMLDVLGLVTSHDQQLTTDVVAEIRKRSGFEEVGGTSALTWETDQIGFEVDCENWNRWSSKRGVWRHWSEEADSSNNQTRNNADNCPLWGDSEGIQKVFVSPDFGWSFQQVFCTDLFIANCTVGQWRCKSRWIASSPGEHASALNRYHSATGRPFCKSSVCIDTLFWSK